MPDRRPEVLDGSAGVTLGKPEAPPRVQEIREQRCEAGLDGHVQGPLQVPAGLLEVSGRQVELGEPSAKGCRLGGSIPEVLEGLLQSPPRAGVIAAGQRQLTFGGGDASLAPGVVQRGETAGGLGEHALGLVAGAEVDEDPSQPRPRACGFEGQPVGVERIQRLAVHVGRLVEHAGGGVRLGLLALESCEVARGRVALEPAAGPLEVVQCPAEPALTAEQVGDVALRDRGRPRHPGVLEGVEGRPEGLLRLLETAQLQQRIGAVALQLGKAHRLGAQRRPGAVEVGQGHVGLVEHPARDPEIDLRLRGPLRQAETGEARERAVADADRRVQASGPRQGAHQGQLRAGGGLVRAGLTRETGGAFESGLGFVEAVRVRPGPAAGAVGVRPGAVVLKGLGHVDEHLARRQRAGEVAHGQGLGFVGEPRHRRR